MTALGWEPTDLFCPKCGKQGLYRQPYAKAWPKFACKSCDALFNIEIFRVETVRIIDEAA
jgi:transposase-like protein